MTGIKQWISGVGNDYKLCYKLSKTLCKVISQTIVHLCAWRPFGTVCTNQNEEQKYSNFDAELASEFKGRHVEDVPDAECHHPEHEVVVVNQEGVAEDAKDESEHDLPVRCDILGPVRAQQDVQDEGQDGQALKHGTEEGKLGAHNTYF